jgi:predicted RNA-binding Zn-ribbon protein involved in translation (DUF1610 family)
MLPFTHIKDEVCPQCGSAMVGESRGNRHTNGNWNEYRRFDCGLRLHYSPNFDRVELEVINGQYGPEDTKFGSMCKKDPRLAKHRTARGKELELVRAALAGITLDGRLLECLNQAMGEYERGLR